MRRQQIEFVGPLLFLSPRLVSSHSHFSLPWESLSTLSLFSEQRLGFSMLPLRVGLWLRCIQRLTTIKVQFPWVLGWAILVNLVEVSAKVVVLVLRPVWRTGSCSFCRDEEARYLKWLHWKASWVFSFSAVLCLFQIGLLIPSKL